MTRVLVVDDSQTVLNFLRVVFEGEHYEVVTATDGHEGLTSVQQRRPDVIVTDSIMPGLDGFGFLQALRADSSTASIPVIMLTSGDPDDPEFAGREPKPDVFVKKSADISPLLAEVQAALQRR